MWIDFFNIFDVHHVKCRREKKRNNRETTNVMDEKRKRSTRKGIRPVNVPAYIHNKIY